MSEFYNSLKSALEEALAHSKGEIELPSKTVSMPDEELKMYTKYVDGKPYQYRYGESWRAMQLYVDGGYPTPEEAKAAWEAEQEKNRVFCPNCGKRTRYELSTRRIVVETKGVKFTYPEEYAECVECYHEVYVPTVNDINAKCRERYYQAHKNLQK